MLRQVQKTVNTCFTLTPQYFLGFILFRPIDLNFLFIFKTLLFQISNILIRLIPSQTYINNSQIFDLSGVSHREKLGYDIGKLKN